jgi:hypothetical protein
MEKIDFKQLGTGGAGAAVMVVGVAVGVGIALMFSGGPQERGQISPDTSQTPALTSQQALEEAARASYSPEKTAQLQASQAALEKAVKASRNY